MPKDIAVAQKSSADWRLAVFGVAVAVFIAPKLFGFYPALNISSPFSRWLFILLTDILPFAVIASWAWAYAVPGPSGDGGSPRRADPLLTLRFAACMMVLFGHFFGVVFPVDGVAALARHPATRLLMSSPWAGVWIFFTLSGYLMGKGFFASRYSLDHTGIARFICNRGLRILPVYLLAVLLVSSIKAREIYQPSHLWMLMQNLSLDYNGALPINVIGALWSVSTEFQFYLLAPFLAILINAAFAKWPLGIWSIPITAISGVLVACAVAYHLHRIGTLHTGGFYTSIYTPIGTNLYLFLGGMLLAKLMQGEPRKQAAKNLALGFGILAMLYVTFTLLASYTFYMSRFSGEYLLFGPPIVLCATLAIIWLFEHARVAGWLAPVITWTQLGGTLTYCLYVVHEPVILWLRSMALATIGLREQFEYSVIAAALISVISYVAYYLVEKPFAKLRY